MNLFTQQQQEFRTRHIGPNELETNQMLKETGNDSVEDLIGKTIPAAIRLKTPLQNPDPQSEFEYLNELKKVASKNKLFKTYIGQGYYGTITPSVILRNIFENPGWYTQYTPYQAEISQ
ncbi:MAG: glycine dehydrogenase (aminomethyl-transferring), partial [Chitinophagaceae bacterium]